MSSESALLAGYLEALRDVGRTGRRLTHEELAYRRELGIRAAENSVPLGTVVGRYLGATRQAWAQLPASVRGDRAEPAAERRADAWARATATGTRTAADHPPVYDIAAAIMRAADDAIVALAEGYDAAQRTAIRAEEALRREFIDDLLHGGDPGRLAERAGRFGMQLAAHHIVAVVRDAGPFLDADERTRNVSDAIRIRLVAHGLDPLLTTKAGLLVCVVTGADAGLLTEHVPAALGHHRPGSVGVGRSHPGPGGVARSYDDARTALDLAERLGLPVRQLRGADLLVYQVLGRDRAALVDLVSTVLMPLQAARGGARPLLDTLTAYFAAGNATAAARALHLSVRALTYRLDRVQRLTGYDPCAPEQRYTLETAVLGARMLGWPERALPPKS
jgi:hypothetical protein